MYAPKHIRIRSGENNTINTKLPAELRNKLFAIASILPTLQSFGLKLENTTYSIKKIEKFLLKLFNQSNYKKN